MSKELDKNISVEQSMVLIEHRKPEDYKVNIWGHELCNGAEWQDFLDVVNKLGKEKADLEAKLAEKERTLKSIMSGEQIPATIAEQYIKLSNKAQIKLLEEVKEYLVKNMKIATDKLNCACYLNNQIEEIKKGL